jgi:hypothetical protein
VTVAPRDQAAELLSHYITLCMRQAGLTPDGDTIAELTLCVDFIITAAVDEIQALVTKAAQPPIAPLYDLLKAMRADEHRDDGLVRGETVDEWADQLQSGLAAVDPLNR